MPTCSEVLAGTLRDAGVTRMFGLPGGEILDFMDAARRAGIQFLLTRHEATAAFMADVTGQITRRPGVCVSTLGPGAVNMTLGVANAFLDRSPLVAITACHARRAAPFATHQKLDLNGVYRPFTKATVTLDGIGTAEKVSRLIEISVTPRMGPVHIALPSDVARSPEEPAAPVDWIADGRTGTLPSDRHNLDQVVDAVRAAKRPVAIVGIDLNPHRDSPAVAAFVERLNVPTLVTPKAKGMLPEDHPLFYGVCAGVSGDSVVVDFLRQADLLIGIGFEPVESDKLWHQSLKVASIGPLSIAADDYRPFCEVIGDVPELLRTVGARIARPFESTPADRTAFRSRLEGVLRPPTPLRGLSGFELTRRLRELFPRHTVFTTDVGSVKMITTQAWTAYEPLTFFESNGLSAMSYSFPAAMAARLCFPDRPVLCAIGDGGFGMTMADVETCVRERLHFVTVVFNDSSLSLIDVAQQRRGYPSQGVRYGPADFGAASAALGAWAARVATMTEFESAVLEAQRVDRPAVIDVVVDPAEYVLQTSD